MSTNHKKSTKTFTLNTGAEIPAIALGTWQEQGKYDGAYKFVLHALKNGYRHIDTAASYRNEEEVGKAIRDSGVPREEIFVTTKLPEVLHRYPQKSLDISLKRLGLDYVDLFLIHWPVPRDPSDLVNEKDFEDRDLLYEKDDRPIDKDWDFIKTWELVQELPATGKARAVGVSNFSVKNLEDLKAAPTTKLVPAANQIELHPLLPQVELIKYGKENGIITEAYSPLGRGPSSPFWDNPKVKEIAAKYEVNVGQLVINWGISRGYVVLPKSANPERIEANLLEFEIQPEDVETITKLSETEGESRIVNPSWDWPLFQ